MENMDELRSNPFASDELEELYQSFLKAAKHSSHDKHQRQLYYDLASTVAALLKVLI